MLSQVQFNKKFGLPRPKRTNLEKKYFGNPNRHGWKETKGYIKKMFSSLDTADSKMAGRIQRQIRRHDRRAARKQIELGLLDFELEQESKALNAAKDMMMCGYGYGEEDSSLDNFVAYMYEDDDYFSEPEEPSRLKGASYDYAIVDELDLRWQYKHEGD